MKRVQQLTVGQNRGKNRIYVDSFMLKEAGWEPGQPLEIKFGKTTVIWRGQDGAKYHISKKRRGQREVSVLDLNNAQVTEHFTAGQKVKVYYHHDRIVITEISSVVITEVRKVERENPLRKFRILDICSGAGIASSTMCDKGLYELVGAVDLMESALATVAMNHRNTSLYLGDAMLWDASEYRNLKVDVLMAGIDCRPYSEMGLRDAEVAPTNALPLHMLKVALQVGAKAIYFENVPGFLKSLWYKQFKNVAEAAGGKVYDIVQDSFDFGSLASRHRAYCVTLLDKNATFEFPQPRLNPGRRKKVKHFLRSIEDRKWLSADDCPTIKYFLGKHREQQDARGNNFNFNKSVFDINDEKIIAIPASYHKLPATGPWIKHPTKQGLYSAFEPEEIAAILGVPEGFRLPEWLSKSSVVKLLGQSVDCRVVGSHAVALAGTLMEMAFKAKKAVSRKVKRLVAAEQVEFAF